jgi:hypothetical protein
LEAGGEGDGRDTVICAPGFLFVFVMRTSPKVPEAEKQRIPGPLQ